MSGIALPIDASSGSPSFPAAQHRAAQSALMLGRTDRALGAVSGVRAGSEPTVTVTSTQYTVTPFAGVVDPGTAATVGPYLVAFLANEVGGINAADATQQRIDRLDVQVPDDPAAGQPLNAQIIYTAGVPGSGAAPAGPSRSFKLGEITVPASGSGAPSWAPTGQRKSVASGGVLPVASSTLYPSHPFVGQIVYDAAIDALFRWDGTAWHRPDSPAYYRHATFSKSIPDSTVTSLTATATVKEIKDPNASSPWSAGVFTAPADDLYTFHMRVKGVDGTNSRNLLILSSSDTDPIGFNNQNSSSQNSSVEASNVWLPAGSTVQFQIYQTSGAAVTFTGFLTVKQR